MNFQTTIGLEVHIEVNSNSKIFSPSPVKYGGKPNSNTNIIDWGYPGTLPTLNKSVIEKGMMAALALNAKISPLQRFSRKNYFYPDNPKGYQITQATTPLGKDGWINIETNHGNKKVGIEELHVEEDAGKSRHESTQSYVDLNRQGTPLIEIVSKPDLSSPQDAYNYLENLREKIQFTGISDVKMEEGSMRVDVNISIRPIGESKFGNKIEIKNLNSFNFVKKSLEYEEKRQRQALLSGKTITPQTRRYDEKSGKTVLMRKKEGKDDYRYFPEPDLSPVEVSQEWIDKVKNKLPETANKRRNHYINDLGITAYDAKILTQTKEMADFYEELIKLGSDPKLASNYLQGNVNEYLNENHEKLENTKITPQALNKMIELITKGTISSKMAKKVFKAITTGEDPVDFVKRKGLVQLSDPKELQPIITSIIKKNPQSAQDFNNGKDRALGYLVGQIMKETRGKANPKVVNELLLKSLKD